MISMRAILIDDEPLSLEFLERQINKVCDISVERKFTNFIIEDNHSLLRSIDIVFLDIEMPGKNGLELAEIISSTYPHITIIFVTAFNHYAAEAFELNALDYLLKPIQAERLQKTLNRISSIEKPIVEDVDSLLPMYVQLCHEFKLTLSDGEVKIIQWRTARAKELFLYLVHHHGTVVRKTEIIELLWENFNMEQAYAQLYTTIYHIRNTLKELSSYFEIDSVSDGYVLTTKHVIIDMKEWDKAMNTLGSISDDTINQYEEAMKLYTGIYLEMEDYLWLESERHRLTQRWLKVAHALASYYYKANELEHTERWLSNICKRVPDDENAHFFLMKIYAELGYGVLVNHQYSQLVKSLKELDLTVHPTVEEWYRDFKQTP